MDTDVLISGAGPTGLMLANQLVRRGVRPIIIDRHSGPAQQTRAMAVQARTLEIYSYMGIVEQALALGVRATGANLWANGRLTARIPLGDIGQSMSPFPYVLMLGQDDNERIMGEKLREYGVGIQWNTQLVELEQHPEHVVVTLKEADGPQRKLRVAWVAGCDGSHSAVRELTGISFPGAAYEHTFFVADTEATGAMKQGELNVYLLPDAFHLFFPMRGKDRWRVIGILPEDMRDRDNLTFDEVAPEIRRQIASELEFKSCSWFSSYRIYHRAAEKFRSRRCFLLGDAAHVHSPAGGQGMNTGLQDAYNLGWKLALVVNGDADSSLLDTYEQERLPVAQRLLRTTDRLFQIIVADGWFGTVFRTRVLARLAAFAMTKDRVRKLAFRTISQIGIRYPQSTLSLTPPGVSEGAPVAGDRFPWLQLKLRANGSVEDLFRKLDDTRFNLLVFGQPAPSQQSLGSNEMLLIHEIAEDPANAQELARVHITGPAFYLLRPDGHIGVAGGRMDVEAVGRYFSDRHLRIEQAPSGRHEARTHGNQTTLA